jgi:hypothetical protein
VIIAKAKEIEDKSALGLAIWVKNAHSDTDLEKFIQERFGEEYKGGCKLGKKTLGFEGVYDVGIDSVTEPIDKSDYPSFSCWINWMMEFKYSPQYQRAAMWDIGQDEQFPPLDLYIAKSFRFIERKP